MLRLDEIPDMVDAPEATGPLSADEEERWEICQRGFRQAKDAWFVAARLLELALRGRLWRASYNTAAEFIKGETGMSTSNAYRQIGGSEVAAILAAEPRLELEGPPVVAPSTGAAPTAALDNPESEQESNDLSRTRDTGESREQPPTAQDSTARPLQQSSAANTEQESNDLSRTRDNEEQQRPTPSSAARPAPRHEPLVISQRAAEALNPVREDYGARVAADAYRTISKAARKDPVSGKLITEVVRQLPRKQDEDLTPRQLHERIRSIISEQARRASAPDPVQEYAVYVEAARVFAEQTEGFADAYKRAAESDAAAANQLTQALRTHLAVVADNLPEL